jgi:uncharacterized phiE125 gp8 family phage protein
MPLYLVTKPPFEPVTLEEAKAHCRIDHGDDDTYISSLIKVAREKIDGRDGLLGRAIVAQTWDWKFDRFDRRHPEGSSHDRWEHRADLWHCERWRLELPLPPLQSVVSVKYLDINAVEQTLDPSTYIVTGANGWQPAQIEPAANTSWPTVYCQPEAIRIRLSCGYAPLSPLSSPPVQTDYALNVPETLKLAIKIMVAAWYENRDTLGMMPDSVPGLIYDYRTNWFF